jgi:membrane protease YdiL (CAAX protease family)
MKRSYDTVPFKIIELVCIFVGLPLFFLYALLGNGPLVPYLIILGVVFFIILYRSKSFDNKWFINLKNLKKELKSIFIIFIPVALALGGYTYLFFNEYFLMLPKTNVFLWGMIMILYPIFSVIPQGLLYRAYFKHRFSNFFKTRTTRIIFSALFFSFGHIIFKNIMAILFTFLVGLLLMYRYEKSNSLAASVLEHALYGDLIFTIGLGINFYSGYVS